MESPRLRALQNTIFVALGGMVLGMILFALFFAWRIGEDTKSVRASWDNKDLRFYSIHCGIVITHVMGFSNGTQVGAPLKKPLWILDSSPVVLSCAEWQALEWRGDGGASTPAPPCGSETAGLYTRMEYTVRTKP